MNAAHAMNLAQSPTRLARLSVTDLFRVVARLMLAAESSTLSAVEAGVYYDAADLAQRELRDRGCSSLAFVEIREITMRELRLAS